MSFFIYQRQDPRYSDWISLSSQQVRLRNLVQVVGINLNTVDNDQVYYTLHLTPMSAPFFTSETQPVNSKLNANLQGGATVTWRQIEPRQISSVKLSAIGLIIRIWSTRDGSQPIVSWGVHFKGLHFLGFKDDWNTQNFAPKSIILRLPCGYFTAAGCRLNLSQNPQRFVSYEVSNGSCRRSYSVKNLAALHRIQRSLLEELELARKLRFQIGIYGFSSESTLDHHSFTPVPSSTNDSSIPRSTSISKVISQLPIKSPYDMQLIVSGRTLIRVQQEKNKIKWKEEIESKRLLVSLLRDERGRAEGRIHRLKHKTCNIDDATGDLMTRVHCLGRERDRLRDYKHLVHEMRQRLAEKQAQLNLRKKQLISELLFVYPLQLIEGSKRFSISEVQLPNAEDYGNESGAQISVALGYTSHLVAMLAFFLGIPLRYPIKHFGSRSRIIDHITTQIPNEEREFPLYFRGREDVYSKYAVYLLNKNIAQIRWYCGLSTQDLRTSLPNLYNVLTSRLTIPGWPLSPGDNCCEVAQELTEEIGQTLFQNDTSAGLSLSLDGGLDQITTPRPVDDLHMQSWFRSSYSDLKGIGGGNNSVPSSQIYYGSRAQNRFLRSWRKKTYTEPEHVDPQWLTDSLNLEFDLGRRPSVAAPLPFTVSSNESTNSNDMTKSRKRRHGRVEQSHVLQQNNNCDNKSSRPPTTSSATSPSSLTKPNSNSSNNKSGMDRGSSSSQAPSSPFTPNRRMVEVEQQIKDNERRKSVCDVSHVGGGHSSPTVSHSGSGHFIVNSSKGATGEFLLPELPQTDDWRTTDEEKLDDSIADVIRKISLIEMQLNRLPPQPKESWIESDEHSNSSALSPVQKTSQTTSQLCTVQENEDPGNTSSTTMTANDEFETQSETSTPIAIQSPSEEYSKILGKDDQLEQVNNHSRNLHFCIVTNSVGGNLGDRDVIGSDRGRDNGRMMSKAKGDETICPVDHGKGDGENTSSSLGSSADHVSINKEDDVKTQNISCDSFPSQESFVSGKNEYSKETCSALLLSEISCDNDKTIESRLRELQVRDNAEICNNTTPPTTNNTDNEDDSSALWLRTEALLSSQSFNMIRRSKHSQ